MSKPSPFRALPVERRVALVTQAIKSSREERARFVQRLASRPGGFRAATLQSWPADKLAREIVRLNAQNAQDEYDLLHLLYVEMEPAIQTTFLDAAGVPHTNGQMADGLTEPYADADGVRRGAAAVRERHGADGEHYLRTLAHFSTTGWPGIDQVVAELDAPRTS